MSVLNENVAALVQQFNQMYLILHRIQQCFFLVYPKKKKKKKNCQENGNEAEIIAVSGNL